MIGTPAAVNGTNTRAIAAPSTAAVIACRVFSSGMSSARKSAGNAASSPYFAGSPTSSAPSTPTIVPAFQQA